MPARETGNVQCFRGFWGNRTGRNFCSGRVFRERSFGERLQGSKRDRGGVLQISARREDARRTAGGTPALPDGVVDSKVFTEATLWKSHV